MRLPDEIATEIVRRAKGRLTLDIPVAGDLLSGAGRRQSYEMAKSGILPTIRLSEHRAVVPVAALLRMVGFEPLNEEEPGSSPDSTSEQTPVPPAPIPISSRRTR